MKRTVSALLFAALTACKSGGVPSDAKTTVMSFPDLDCSDCGIEMAKAILLDCAEKVDTVVTVPTMAITPENAKSLMGN